MSSAALSLGHFKAQFFVDLWPLAIARKRGDMRKQFLAAFGRLNKTKAPVVIPLGQFSLKTHGIFSYSLGCGRDGSD